MPKKLSKIMTHFNKTFLLSVLIGTFFSLFRFGYAPPKEFSFYPLKDSVEEEKDILASMLLLNQDTMPKPPASFRSGHITQADLTDYITMTDDGYTIQLPNNTNVPTASVYDGKVLVSGGFGSKQYYAFDAQTGEKKWAINLDDDGPSTAAIENDMMVFNTESCTIFACNVQTGEQLWSYWLGDPLMSSPTIANGKVFTAYPAHYGSSAQGNLYNDNHVPTQQQLTHKTTTSFTDLSKLKLEANIHPTHVLACFELKTGKILWQKWIDGDVMSAPVAQDNMLYITTFPGTLFKINQETGDMLSAKRMRATSAPVIYQNEILVSQRADRSGETVSEQFSIMSKQNTQLERKIAKKEAPYLDKQVQERTTFKGAAEKMDSGNGFSGGAPANSGWMQASDNIGYSNVSSLQSFQGSRALHFKGNNYTTMGDELICNNPQNDKEVWKIKLDGDLKQAGGFMGTPPLNVGNYIVIATFTGEILILEAESGKLHKKYQTKESIRYQPVVENGWIYATSTNGKLIAINTQNPALTGWSQWGANAARTNSVN
jgi:Ca-activated chloride channel homolog